MEEAIWAGTVQLYWRDNDLGGKTQDLYVGRLFVGEVFFGTHNMNENFRWCSYVHTHAGSKWFGGFATKRLAKDAAEDAVIKALLV